MVGDRRLGGVEVTDQLAGVAWLKQQPFVDPARIGVFGWSYGGYMTLMLMSQSPGTFAAGVAGAPVTDYRLYDTHYTERYLGTPQENPEGYRTCAPINYAEGLRGDLLIITGSGESNTHIEITEGLVDRLIALGKRFDYFVYPNRDHGLHEGNGTEVHVRMLIIRYLLE